MIEIRFRCGHTLRVDPDRVQRPSCLECGETMVARVQAPPPRFVGTVTGPLAETKHMEPAHVDLAPGGALRLKSPDKEKEDK